MGQIVIFTVVTGGKPFSDKCCQVKYNYREPIHVYGLLSSKETSFAWIRACRKTLLTKIHDDLKPN